jgi:hypothetical protein
MINFQFLSDTGYLLYWLFLSETIINSTEIGKFSIQINFKNHYIGHLFDDLPEVLTLPNLLSNEKLALFNRYRCLDIMQ